MPITGVVPRPERASPTRQARRRARGRSTTWASTPGTRMQDIAIDTVFIGSCTNSRIEDLREVGEGAGGPQGQGRHPRDGRAGLGPGAAPRPRRKGSTRIFIEAGFEWREPGCSMCLAMNPDKVAPGERCASTSNRNFEGRQGRGGAHPPAVAGDGGGGGDHRPADRRARPHVTARRPLRRALPRSRYRAADGPSMTRARWASKARWKAGRASPRAT